MNRTFPLLALLLATIPPVYGQETEIPKDGARTIRLDPDEANGGSMDQVFSEIAYIPLETSRESLFGDIDEMEVTEDTFVILDRDTKNILTFDKQGKYRSKIDMGKIVGSGVDLENLYVRFSLKKSGSDYTIQIFAADRAYAFDSRSKPLGSPKKLDMKQEPAAVHHFSDSLRVCHYFRSPGGYYEYAFLDGDRIVAKYFAIDTTDRTGDFGVGGGFARPMIPRFSMSPGITTTTSTGWTKTASRSPTHWSFPKNTPFRTTSSPTGSITESRSTIFSGTTRRSSASAIRTRSAIFCTSNAVRSTRISARTDRSSIIWNTTT